MNDLDFQGIDIGYLELYGSLDGKNNTLSNIEISTSSGVEIGLFKVIDAGTLKNITFDNLNYSNNVAYNTQVSAGLIAGTIQNGSTLSSISIENSTMNFRTSSNYANVGAISGVISNATVMNISMSNTQINYIASNTSSTSHLYTGLFFGLISSLDYNGKDSDVTIQNLSSSKNTLEHTAASQTLNYPGLIAGYVTGRQSSPGITAISGFVSTNDTLIIFTWPNSKDWTFGTIAQFNNVFTSNLDDLVDLNIVLPE